MIKSKVSRKQDGEEPEVPITKSDLEAPVNTWEFIEA